MSQKPTFSSNATSSFGKGLLGATTSTQAPTFGNNTSPSFSGATTQNQTGGLFGAKPAMPGFGTTPNTSVGDFTGGDLSHTKPAQPAPTQPGSLNAGSSASSPPVLKPTPGTSAFSAAAATLPATEGGSLNAGTSASSPPVLKLTPGTSAFSAAAATLPATEGGKGLLGATTSTQAPSFGNNTSTSVSGATTQNQTGGLFGAKPAMPGFGTTPNTSVGDFTGGDLSHTKPAQPAPTQPGLLGVTTCTKAPTFGTNTFSFAFGATTQNQTGGLFGAKPAMPGFGTTPNTSVGDFTGGDLSHTKPAQPAPTQPGLLGVTTCTKAPTFGTNTFNFAFGATTQNQTGGLFGAKPAMPGFGTTPNTSVGDFTGGDLSHTKPAQPAPTQPGLLGVTTCTKAPTFGTNTFNFAFGATTQNQTGGLFGAKPAMPGFGTTPNTSVGDFTGGDLSHTKPAQPAPTQPGLLGVTTCTKAPTFGTNTFTFAIGATTQNQTGGLFGAKPAMPGFGTTPNTSVGDFTGGDLSHTKPAQPAPTQPGLLGVTTCTKAPTFGTNTFTFAIGATTQNQTGGRANAMPVRPRSWLDWPIPTGFTSSGGLSQTKPAQPAPAQPGSLNAGTSASSPPVLKPTPGTSAFSAADATLPATEGGSLNAGTSASSPPVLKPTPGTSAFSAAAATLPATEGAPRTPGTGGSPDDLPPLTFHREHGEGIWILNDGSFASKVQVLRSIAFSARPVKVNEKVCLLFVKNSGLFDLKYNNFIFGFTSHDPAALAHSLRMDPYYFIKQPGNWAEVQRLEEYNILHYYVNSAGDVHFGINEADRGFFLAGVDTKNPLWALVVFNKNTIIQFLDPRSRAPNQVRRQNQSPVDEDRLKAPRTPGTGGSLDDLPPLTFHSVHGEGIRIFNDGSIASMVQALRRIGFSARPVKVNEKVCVRFAEKFSLLRNNFFNFGFTSNDPATLTHTYTYNFFNEPGNWAFIEIVKEDFKEIFDYYVNSAGDVHFSINGENERLLFSGVDTENPLWVFVCVRGAQAVEFVAPRAPNQVRTQNLRPVDEDRLEESLSSLCVNEPLPPPRHASPFLPLSLHRTKGRNVQLLNDRGVAARVDEEIGQGYVFTAQPMRPGQKIVVQVLFTELAYDGSLAIGLTSCDPASLRPCDLPADAELLLDRPEYWVVQRDAAKGLGRGDELAVTLTMDGEVRVSRNGSTPVTVMHVDHTVKLWAFFDICGATKKVRMLTTEAVTSPPQQSRVLTGTAAPLAGAGGTVVIDSSPPQNNTRNAADHQQGLALSSAHHIEPMQASSQPCLAGQQPAQSRSTTQNNSNEQVQMPNREPRLERIPDGSSSTRHQPGYPNIGDVFTNPAVARGLDAGDSDGDEGDRGDGLDAEDSDGDEGDSGDAIDAEDSDGDEGDSGDERDERSCDNDERSSEGGSSSIETPRTTGTGGSPDDLPPLTFHSVHWEGVGVSSDGSFASRNRGNGHGIAFSARPVKVNEKVCLRITQNLFSHINLIYFGFTSHDPAKLAHLLSINAFDFIDKPGNWVKGLRLEKDKKLDYYFNSAKDVHFSINEKDKGLLLAGVDTRNPLWAIVSLSYGTTVQFLDPRPRAPNQVRRQNQSPVDEQRLQAPRTPGTGGSPDDQPPLTFHSVHGKDVMVSSDGSIASTVRGIDGIAFSARPVKVNEKVCLRIIKTERPVSRFISFGFTSHDPATIAHTSAVLRYINNRSSEGNWAKKEMFEEDNIFDYYVNSAGHVYFSINGADKGLFLAVVDPKKPFWALIVLSDTDTAVQFVDPIPRAPNLVRTPNQSPVDEERLQALRTPGTGGSPDNLPPLTFHSECGGNLNVSHDGSIVNKYFGFLGRCSIAFSARPVMVNEKVCFRFVKSLYNTAFCSGFTSHDPAILAYSLPKNVNDFINKPGIWVFIINFKENFSFDYYVNSAGDVHVSINGKNEKLLCSGVDTKNPLWALVQVEASLEFVTPRAPNQVRRQNQSLADENRLVGVSMRSLSVDEPLPPTRYANPLVPLSLHRTKGRNVQLLNDRGVAVRVDEEIGQGYVFTAQPMRPGQTLVLQVLSTKSGRAAGIISFGLTSCDPASLRPCDLPADVELLLDRPEYWDVQRIAAHDLSRGDELAVTLNMDGKVTVIINGKTPVTVMHVDHTVRHWAFYDICEAAKKVRMLTTEAVPSPPQQLRVLTGTAAPLAGAGGTVLVDSSPPQNNALNPADHLYTEPIRASSQPCLAGQQPAEGNLTETECTICYDNPIDSALYACGHMCMCHSCAVQQWKGNGNGQCPQCRAEIIDVLRIYKS